MNNKELAFLELRKEWRAAKKEAKDSNKAAAIASNSAKIQGSLGGHGHGMSKFSLPHVSDPANNNIATHSQPAAEESD